VEELEKKNTCAGKGASTLPRILLQKIRHNIVADRTRDNRLPGRTVLGERSRLFRKTVSAIMLFLLVVSMLTLAFKIQSVRADDGTIIINADGSISPQNAPIYTADNITYTFTGNITAVTDGIDVERSNIVLDGAGYTVTGSENGMDITLVSMGNVTINNMMITNNIYGIYLESSSNCTLSGNNITNNIDGVYLYSSSNNTLSDNIIANDYDGIYLVSSSGNTLLDNNVTANNDAGIYFYSSSSNNLNWNNITGTGFNITGTGNNLLGNSTGIMLESSSNNNNVNGNSITSNDVGILFDSSSNNSISGNNITNNSDGTYLYSSSNNSLNGNSITANTYDGIYLGSSSSNAIYHNNFINNTNQVSSSNSTNVWDNGSMGNYWSDYLTRNPNATQVDSSGVWNTPYVIDKNNTDHYPLMVPYGTLNPKAQQQLWLFKPEVISSIIIGWVGLVLVIIGVVLVRRKRKKIQTSGEDAHPPPHPPPP